MFRVHYPLISRDGSRDFATREEAERFADEMRNRQSPYLTVHSWRLVRVEEIADAPATKTLSETREIAFHVQDRLGGPRWAITRGKFNFARCEVDTGAVVATFIPDSDSVEDIMRALPHGQFYEPCGDAAQHVSRDAEADEADKLKG